jgi:hypothetical protein
MKKMVFEFVDSIKRFFLKNQHQEIKYNELDAFLENKKVSILAEIESKEKEEILKLNDVIKVANAQIVTLSQKKPKEELEEQEKDKVRDAIVDFVNESRKVLKGFVFFEDDKEKLVESLESSDKVIDDYEKLIRQKKDILAVQFKEEMDVWDKEYLKFKDTINEAARKLSREKLKRIDRILELSKKITDIETRKSELEDKRAKMSENLAKIEEVKEKHVSKIDEFKMSPDFSKFHETLAKKKITMDKLSEHKEMFEHDFEKLKPAIVYYQSKYYKNIFNKYLEDPYSALLDDEGDKFVECLPDLRDKTNAGEIPIDPEKKKLVLETISKWTRHFIESQIDEYKESKEDKFKYDRLLSSNKIMSDYTELEYKIDHINNKLKDQKEILREVVGELTALDSEKIVLEAEDKLSEEFGGKFAIIVSKKNDKNAQKQTNTAQAKAKEDIDDDF